MQERMRQRFRALLVAVVALVLSFSLFRPTGTLLAVLVRRHWPQAWFSGLIVWYFDFFAVGLSITVAVFAALSTLRRQQRPE